MRPRVLFLYFCIMYSFYYLFIDLLVLFLLPLFIYLSSFLYYLTYYFFYLTFLLTYFLLSSTYIFTVNVLLFFRSKSPGNGSRACLVFVADRTDRHGCDSREGVVCECCVSTVWVLFKELGVNAALVM